MVNSWLKGKEMLNSEFIGKLKSWSFRGLRPLDPHRGFAPGPHQGPYGGPLDPRPIGRSASRAHMCPFSQTPPCPFFNEARGLYSTVRQANVHIVLFKSLMTKWISSFCKSCKVKIPKKWLTHIVAKRSILYTVTSFWQVTTNNTKFHVYYFFLRIHISASGQNGRFLSESISLIIEKD